MAYRYLMPLIGSGSKNDPRRPKYLSGDYSLKDFGGLPLAVVMTAVLLPDLEDVVLLDDPVRPRLVSLMKESGIETRWIMRARGDRQLFHRLCAITQTMQAGVDQPEPWLEQDILFGRWKSQAPVQTQPILEIDGGRYLWRMPNGRRILCISGGGAQSILATDNFNRADGGLGANWTTVTTRGAPQINTNVVRSTAVGTDSAAFWNGVTWPNNQYAQSTCVHVNSGQANGPMVRASASAQTFYIWLLSKSASTSTKLYKCVTTTFTTLATGTNGVDGDVVRLSATGTTLSFSKNGSADATSPVTDSAIASGNAGIYVYTDSGTTADSTLDNFEGGQFFSAPSIGACQAVKRAAYF